jgi:hypothetical protein
MAKLREIAPDERQRTLVPNAVIIFAFILNELTTAFVDGIVRQMHEEVIKVTVVRRYILFSGESRETFFVAVNSERIYSTKKHVYPQIELQSFYQERPVKIALDNVVVIRIHIVQVSR